MIDFIEFLEEHQIFRGFDCILSFEFDEDDWDGLDIGNLSDIRASFKDHISGGNIIFAASLLTGEINRIIPDKILEISIDGNISKNWKNPYVEFDLLGIDSNDESIPFPGRYKISVEDRITK